MLQIKSWKIDFMSKTLNAKLYHELKHIFETFKWFFFVYHYYKFFLLSFNFPVVIINQAPAANLGKCKHENVSEWTKLVLNHIIEIFESIKNKYNFVAKS